MATGFEDLGAVAVEAPSSSNDFSDLGAIPVKSAIIPRRFSANPQASIALTPEQKFIQAAQANPIQKFGTSIGDLIDNLIVQPYEATKRATAGLADIIDQHSTETPDLQSLLLNGPFRDPASRDIIQNIAEGATRQAFNLGNSIDQLAVRAYQHPIDTLSSLSPLAGIANLRSHTPTPDELNQFIADQNKSRGVQSVLSQPILPEMLGKTNVPLANDLGTVGTQVLPVARGAVGLAGNLIERVPGALATPFKAAGRAMENIAQNRAPATYSQVAENALDFTPQQVAEHVPTAIARTRQIIGNEIPKTAQEAVSALDNAENQLYSQRQAINQAADVRGLAIDGNQSIDAAKSALDEIKTITQDEKSRILKKAEELFSGEKKPTEGQLVQEQLNAKLKGFYNAEDPVATAQQKVDLAVRNSYADQMDQINQAMTGRAETPYSDIGNIIETRNALAKKLDQINMSQADIKGGIGKAPIKTPSSISGAKVQATKTVLSNLQKNQLTKLNEATQKIFSGSPASIVSSEIPATTLNDLIASKTATSPSSLQEQIQSLNQGYNLPPEYQNLPDSIKQQIIDQINNAPLVNSATARRVGKLNP